MKKAANLAIFHSEFIDDLRYWVLNDRKLAIRCLNLVEAVLRDPTRGIGKPEKLRYLGGDVWSRRLSQEHRVVYLIGEDRIQFLQARYHY